MIHPLQFIYKFSRYLLVISVLGLVACSQTPKEKTPEAPAKKVEVPDVSETTQAETKGPVSAEMSAGVMYKVLLSEMLVKRGQPGPAYQLMSEAAKETRDPGLAERNFQMSMATFNIEAIKDSTELWRDVAPNEDVPWKASYLMAVRDGKQEEGFAYWQQYVNKTDLSLDRALVEASGRVAQSAPKKEGLKFMKKLMDTYPKEPAAYYAFGASADAYQQSFLAVLPLEKAAELYEQEMESPQPESSKTNAKLRLPAEKMYRGTHLLLATVYLKSYQPKLGLKKLEDYVDDHPKDWEMQEKYARLEVKAGQFKDAENRYQYIVDNEPDAHTSRLSLALIQLEEREYEASQENLSVLTKEHRFKSTANYYLGIAFYEQGQKQKAKQYFNKIKTDDYYLDAQLRIADIDYPQKGLQETLDFLNTLEPKNNEQRVKLYRAQAVFYNRENKKQKAVESYDQALTVNKNDVDLLLAQSMLFYDLNDFDRYQQNLKLALEQEPNNPDALNALGYFYVEQNQQLDEAKVLLDKALTISPNRFYILDSRGWLAYQLKDYEEAESYLEKAFDLKDDDEVLIHLIQTKWQLGKQDEAIDLWEENHQKFPENKRLQKLLKELSDK